jgi:heptosyltransferase-2
VIRKKIFENGQLNMFLFSIANNIITFFSKSFYNRFKKEKTIAIFRTGALGDFLFSVCSFNLLREKFPDHKLLLVYLTSGQKETRNNINVYNNSNYPWVAWLKGYLINDYIVLNNTSFSDIRMVHKFCITNKVSKFLLLPTPSENPFRILKKIIFLRFSGFFGSVYGLNLSSFKFVKEIILYKDYVNRRKVIHHVEQCFISTFNLLGENIDFTLLKNSLDIHYLIEDNQFLFHLFNKHGIFDEDDYIIISPGSLKPHKIWPKEKYIILIKWILRRNNKLKIFICGTKNDLSICQFISSTLANARVIDLCGNTNFMELSLLVNKSFLVIGNDGGLLHLASCLNKKVISIIPSLEPKGSVYPYGNINLQHYNSEIECKECYSMNSCPLNHSKCINDIGVNEIINTLEFYNLL